MSTDMQTKSTERKIQLNHVDNLSSTVTFTFRMDVLKFKLKKYPAD